MAPDGGPIADIPPTEANSKKPARRLASASVSLVLF